MAPAVDVDLEPGLAPGLAPDLEHLVGAVDDLPVDPPEDVPAFDTDPPVDRSRADRDEPEPARHAILEVRDDAAFMRAADGRPFILCVAIEDVEVPVRLRIGRGDRLV